MAAENSIHLIIFNIDIEKVRSKSKIKKIIMVLIFLKWPSNNNNIENEFEDQFEKNLIIIN